MKTYAKTNKVLFVRDSGAGYKTVEVASKTNPDVKYVVDMTNGRCSCPAWKFIKKGGERKVCKHLKALGFRDVAAYN